jgi:hypothetical protein
MRMTSKIGLAALGMVVACSYDASQLAGPPKPGVDSAAATVDGPGISSVDTGDRIPDSRMADTNIVAVDVGVVPDVPIASGGISASGGSGGYTEAGPADAKAVGGTVGAGGVPGNGGAPAEPSRDAESNDAPSATTCTTYSGTSTAGHPPIIGAGAACIVTCDSITGWGCANFDGRTITVNGTAVACGATITKTNGTYIFQIGAGTNSVFSIYWWGTFATTCSSFDGGAGAGGSVGQGGEPATGPGGASGTGGAPGGDSGNTVSQYTVSGDGLTVVDTSTGLTWQREAPDSAYTWADAQSYCAGLTLDGSGWTLPTLTQLQSIVDTTVAAPPTINQTAFPKTVTAPFWTSTALAGSFSGSAWEVNFSNGSSYHFAVSVEYQVRCVR